MNPDTQNFSGEHPHTSVYLRVFLSLLVLTILEYLFARVFAGSDVLLLISGLTALAVIKAVLVGLFFMHLAFEGRWKYLLLVPTAFLAAVVVLGILPDVGFPLGQGNLEAPINATSAPTDSNSP